MLCFIFLPVWVWFGLLHRWTGSGDQQTPLDTPPPPLQLALSEPRYLEEGEKETKREIMHHLQNQQLIMFVCLETKRKKQFNLVRRKDRPCYCVLDDLKQGYREASGEQREKDNEGTFKKESEKENRQVHSKERQKHFNHEPLITSLRQSLGQLPSARPSSLQ